MKRLQNIDNWGFRDIYGGTFHVSPRSLQIYQTSLDVEINRVSGGISAYRWEIDWNSWCSTHGYKSITFKGYQPILVDGQPLPADWFNHGQLIKNWVLPKQTYRMQCDKALKIIAGNALILMGINGQDLHYESSETSGWMLIYIRACMAIIEQYQRKYFDGQFYTYRVNRSINSIVNDLIDIVWESSSLEDVYGPCLANNLRYATKQGYDAQFYTRGTINTSEKKSISRRAHNPSNILEDFIYNHMDLSTRKLIDLMEKETGDRPTYYAVNSTKKRLENTGFNANFS